MKANIRQQGDRALSELARTRKQSDRALTEIAKTVELARDEIADRLEEAASRLERIDTKALTNQAYASTARARRRLGKRMGKRATELQKMRFGRRQRRSFPWGLVVLGVVTLGVAWLVYDQRRREMISGQVTQLGSRTTAVARSTGIASAVDDVMSRVRGQTALDVGALRMEVESAVAEGLESGLPGGLEVAVEGRTVYLRGTVDPILADSAANLAQAVPGVAAVVNLTVPPQGVTGRPTSRRAGSG